MLFIYLRYDQNDHLTCHEVRMYLRPCKSLIRCNVRSWTKMLKFFLLLVAWGCISFVTSWRGLILGPGRWLVLNIEQCEDPDQYDFVFEKISRKKINRTHDCFDISINLDREMNSTYAGKIDIYQEVDGGFKYFQTISDDSACAFIKRHAEENFQRALTNANIDPPDCPFGPGPVVINNFVMDYRELPLNGVYGTFEARVYSVLDGQKKGCMKIIVNFDERNGLDSGEDDFDLL